MKKLLPPDVTGKQFAQALALARIRRLFREAVGDNWVFAEHRYLGPVSSTHIFAFNEVSVGAWNFYAALRRKSWTLTGRSSGMLLRQSPG